MRRLATAFGHTKDFLGVGPIVSMVPEYKPRRSPNSALQYMLAQLIPATANCQIRRSFFADLLFLAQTFVLAEHIASRAGDRTSKRSRNWSG